MNYYKKSNLTIKITNPIIYGGVFMIYKEIQKDLFNVDDSYHLAHCVSSDFSLGMGIAKDFQEKFNLKEKLKKVSPERPNFPSCILTDRIFNLVTKNNYWCLPTHKSLKATLEMMKVKCLESGITKIAMPQIACGIDHLRWSSVSRIIKDVFNDTDIEILVCKI